MLNAFSYAQHNGGSDKNLKGVFREYLISISHFLNFPIKLCIVAFH